MPQRKNYLFVCVNQRPDGTPKGSCAARGGAAVYAKLKSRLKERGLASLVARPCTCSCLDICAAGPVIAVEPGGYFYGKVQVSDVEELVEALSKGTQVKRLLLSKEDFSS